MSDVKYSIVVEDSSGNEYEFNEATKRAWEVYENEVGRCRFFIPYTDIKLTTSSISNTSLSKIRWYRNGTLIWQGIISIVQDTSEGTWVYGETYEAMLGWYGVRYDQAYTTQNVSTIVDTEYDQIVAKTNDAFTLLTKGTIENPYQTSTTNNLTITRTLYNDNFLTLLKEMAAVGRGQMTSAWDQYTTFEITIDEATPTFKFLRNKGSEKADVVFELDSEILDFNIPRDMRGIANSVKGFAIQEGPKVLTSTQTDSTSQTSWYLREHFPYFGQTTNQGELDNKAKTYLNELKDPKRTMSLKFAAGLAPFTGYALSDFIKVKIERGRVSIDEYRRVVGMEVSIDDTGVENTTPLLEVPFS